MSLMSCCQLQRVWHAFAIVIAFLVPVFVSSAQDSTNSPPPAPRRSSVILIIADNVGSGDLGCYGSTKTKTPNLDKLAAEGARFTSFYTGSTMDSPSRAALMLGLHTGHLNIRNDSSAVALHADDMPFSQLLQAAGYRTGLVGMWGLSDSANGLPQNKGFEQFAGLLNIRELDTEYPEFIYRHDPNPIEGTFSGRMQVAGNEQGRKGQHTFDLFTRAATNFVRIAKPEHYNSYRPFFLMLSYPFPQKTRETKTDRDASITRMDVSIGRFLESLKAMNIETNTIVMFTSSSAPQKGGNNKLAEADIRVPLIVRWPARLKPVTISEPWAAWDVFPTMTDIARADCPTNIDGISFSQTLRGQTQTNRHDVFYWETHDTRLGSQQASRMGDWKTMRPIAGGPLELYDLKSDPDEKKNVADKHPDVIAKFEKYLETARTGTDRWPLKKPAENPSPKKNKL